MTMHVRTHRVTCTDYNLSVISQHYYGSPNYAVDIFQANRAVLCDPNRVYQGQVLIIPHIAVRNRDHH